MSICSTRSSGARQRLHHPVSRCKESSENRLKRPRVRGVWVQEGPAEAEKLSPFTTNPVNLSGCNFGGLTRSFLGEHALARLPPTAFAAHGLQSIIQHLAHFPMGTGTGC